MTIELGVPSAETNEQVENVQLPGIVKYFVIDTADWVFRFEVPVYWYTENEDGVLFPVNEYTEEDEQTDCAPADISNVKALLVMYPPFLVQVNFKIAEREFARFIL